MTFSDLILRARALFSPRRIERELHEELAFHLERETHQLIEQGMAPDEAASRARAKFGSVTLAADECRDERGITFIDNTVGDLHYALRTFKRAPLTAVTIVVTVSIGLGVVAVLFSFLSLFLFRVDSVPDVTQMYAVERPRLENGEPSLLTRPRFEAMRSETGVFTDAYASLTDIDLRVDGRIFAVNLVSGNFFDVVRVTPVIGRALSAADDDRGSNSPVVVLSDKGWERHFHRDPQVIGREVLVNGAPFQIIGVMPPRFRGLEVSAPDLWAPLARMSDFKLSLRGSEDKVGVQIVGRLKAGVSKESARSQLAAWDSNQSLAANDRRTTNIELLPHRGTVPQPWEVIAVFTPLFLAFGLILLIGCANVANLLLARGVARQREIGIRLSLGASRRRIIRQLMTESVLLALVAAVGGYLVSRIALEGTVYFLLRAMPMDLGDINLNVPAADWRVALFLVVAAIAATAFFALMPALQATRIDPVRTIRGELVADARPGRARNMLIGVQVFASALLLICAAIFLRSAMVSSRFDPGFRTADTILMDLNEPKRAALGSALAAEPTITAFAAVRPPFLSPPLDGFADTGAGKAPVAYKFVSATYFDVLAIPIVRGRVFTAAEVDGYPVAIVSESVASTLWPNGNAVGETFRIEPDAAVRIGGAYGLQVNPEESPGRDTPMPARVVTVVGVSRDVSGFRLTDAKNAGVFLPTDLGTARTSVVARVAGDPELARQTLFEHLTRIDPNLDNIVTMRTVARLELFFLQMGFWVSLVLGGLALLLTVSGLFSVLSYLVEQRTKEIGLRMALGATSQGVTQLMLLQTARPVLYGLIAGVALAATLATALMATEAGAFISEIVRVTDPIAYTASLVLIVGACLLAAWIPSARAARLDPMKTLRQD